MFRPVNALDFPPIPPRPRPDTLWGYGMQNLPGARLSCVRMTLICILRQIVHIARYSRGDTFVTRELRGITRWHEHCHMSHPRAVTHTRAQGNEDGHVEAYGTRG